MLSQLVRWTSLENEVIKKTKVPAEISSLLHMGMTLQNDNCDEAGGKKLLLTGRIQNEHLYLHRDTKHTHADSHTPTRWRQRA